MTRAPWLVGLVLVMAGAAGAAWADTRIPEGVKVPTWSELSQQEQVDLSMFADRWDRLPASRRVMILERYERWKQLPPRKREALREGERNYRQMSPDQREKMRISIAAVRAQPPAEQRRLRRLWQAMSPQQRRDWLDRGGPGIAPPP